MPNRAARESNEFARVALPKRFCNLDRLLFALQQRGLDGIVATLPYNVFYLSGFNGVAHKADEPRPYAFVLTRHKPDDPVLIIADYYVATFLAQPTWVEDIRPFRAVMCPGVCPGVAIARTPGATSAPSLYWLTFFQFGKVPCSRRTTGRIPSGSFSISAGSVQCLYSTSGIRIAALG